MTHQDKPDDRPSQVDPPRRLPAWAVGVVTVEAISVGIALVMPITPSKTGSSWSPAHLFTPNPTYLEQVAASFVAVNLIFVGLGMLVWLVSRRDRTR